MRRLSVRECGCGRLHWSTRDRLCIGQQKVNAKLCPDCFFQKYQKNRPIAWRFLNEGEIAAFQKSFELQGCRVYKVDPSTL